MKRIVTLRMGEKGVRIFSDSFAVHSIASPQHTHRYPEIHIVLAGSGEYVVGGEHYFPKTGDAILIPADTVHETSFLSDSRVMAFETDLGVDKTSIICMPSALICELDRKEGEYPACLIPVLCYLFSHFMEKDLYSVAPNTDYAYLVDEYIGENYHRRIHLAGLAEELCLSERQVQRVIRASFGMSFCELLNARRIAVAERLAATTNMTWEEIAAYVGFSTYSGFRRAWLREKQRG